MSYNLGIPFLGTYLTEMHVYVPRGIYKNILNSNPMTINNRLDKL